jgi:hypothetical protein
MTNKKEHKVGDIVAVWFCHGIRRESVSGLIISTLINNEIWVTDKQQGKHRVAVHRCLEIDGELVCEDER